MVTLRNFIRGGWKTQGGGKHTVNSAKNPSPKTFLDPPPTIRFPPPFFGDSLSFPLKERGTDQTNPNFWGLQKWFWRAHSAVRFPPPPKFTRYVLPPPQPLPEKTPKTPKISALLRKRPVLPRANFVLTKDRKRPYYRHFCGKIHREGSCSKAAGGP